MIVKDKSIILSKEPSFFYESLSNSQYVIGVDEVGRGALSGPVVTVAARYNLENIDKVLNEEIVQKIKDSKLLSSNVREKIYDFMMTYEELTYSIAMRSNDYIDKFGIVKATKDAMIESVKKISIENSYLLIDGNQKLDIDILQRSIVKGDRKSITIATASVIAKVYRDRVMSELHKEYPMYNWSKNKGYGTKEHLEKIKEFLYSPLHRKTFEPVKSQVKQQIQQE